MLPSSGYFRSIFCPFYEKGLCERPHCHFRHAKKDADVCTRNNLLEDSLYGLSSTDGQPADLLRLVSEAVKKMQREVAEGAADLGETSIIESIAGNFIGVDGLAEAATKTNKYLSSVESNGPKIHESSSKPAPAVVEYKPTPIAQLKKMQEENKYTKALVDVADDMEYDPVSNYSAGLPNTGTKPLLGLKKSRIPYVPSKRVVRSDSSDESRNKKRRLSSNESDFVPVLNSPVVSDSAEFSDGNSDGETVNVESTVNNIIPSSSSSDKFDIINQILTESKICELAINNKSTLPQKKPSDTSSAVKKDGKKEVKKKVKNNVVVNKTKVESEKSSCKSNKSGKSDKNKKSSSVHKSTSSSKKPGSNSDSSSAKKQVSSNESDATKTKSVKVSSSSKKIVTKSNKIDKSPSKSSSENNKDSMKKSSSKSPKPLSKDAKHSSALSPSKHENFQKGSVVESSGKKHSSSHSKSKTKESKHKTLIEKEKSSKSNVIKDNTIAAVCMAEIKKIAEKVCKKKGESQTSNSHKVSDERWKSLVSNPIKEPSKESRGRVFTAAAMELSTIKETTPKVDFTNINDTTSVVDDDASVVDDTDFDLDDCETDLDDHDTYEECLRIFNEYVPTENTVQQMNFETEKHLSEADESTAVNKRRIAHAGLSQNRAAIVRSALNRTIPQKSSPAQVMINRYPHLKNMIDEGNKRLAIPSSSTNTLGNSAFLSTMPSATAKKRIAHVPNATALINARVTIKPRPKPNAAATKIDPTISQTVVKGAKRMAHVPKQVSPRPMIMAEYGSKVPSNIRQRYLNLIIDECLKIYDEEQDAYDRSLAEEKNAYSRSSNRSVYLNVVVNTIHRIRSEATGVIAISPINVPEETSPVLTVNNTTSKVLPQRSLFTSVGKTVSHQFVLGGKKAAQVSFSIERRRSSLGSTEDISNLQLYQALQQYILAKEQLDENGFPRPHASEQGRAIVLKQDPKKISPRDPTDRICCRCGSRFKVSSKGVYLTTTACVYHWGKAFKRRIAGTIDNRYTCCQGDLAAEGCCIAKLHVSDTIQYDNLRGFVTTLLKTTPANGDCGVYALDCEMSYTVHGSELTRVTVIDCNLKQVYETLVKPDNPIVDYNTRFSGITEDDMQGVTTTIRDVQAVLLNKFNSKTILIGHSLESDFRALRLIHNTVVDTSVVFPHRLGLPYKRALRTVVAEYLSKIIQNDVKGHDSKEDAVSCMELMRWKVREDLRKRGF